MKRILPGLLAILISMLLGCAPKMPLDPEQMLSGLPEVFSAQSLAVVDDLDQGGFWWEALGDDNLNALVDSVLKGNRQLLRSDALVAQIHATAIATGAARYPAISLGAEAKASGAGSRETSSYGVSFPASFEIDLWGRLASLEEAARFDLIAAQYNRQALAQSLAAQTTGLYLSGRALEKRLAVADLSVESYKKSLELVESRYRRGLASILDVRQADRLYAQARAAIPALQQEQQAIRQNLAVLAGRFDENSGQAARQPETFSLPPEVPAGLPSELLLNRPDVAAARSTVDALWSRTLAARASRFPSIKLTGSAGFASSELGLLVQQPSQVWSAAAGLTMPLINAGGLKAQEEAALKGYEQAVYSYEQAVLSAFSEVEQALFAREKLLERHGLLVELNRAAYLTLETAQNRYERGLVEYLVVLDAQQAYFLAQNELLGVEAALFQNFVTLNRVLGNGWGGAFTWQAQGRADEAR
ncbi:MAG: TolC family protein [Desulfatibacillaceae bacterium]|nr:TolC family protein [Desulfatibacillaceae bacterium]